MLMVQNQEILCKELGDQQKALFQKYADWSDKYARYISALAFQDGFRLGCQLTSEALAEN